MTGERTVPGLGLTAFYDVHTSGWKPGMDANIQKLSALCQCTVKSRVTSLPGSPTDGDEYIVPHGAGSHPDEIAIRDNGAWVYFTPTEGWLVWLQDENILVYWSGTAWSPLIAYPTITECLIIAIGDETTAITAGVAKVTFRMPYAFTLTSVKASLTTASSSGNPTFDINESGTTILSTKLSIDATEKTSATAATPAVISDASLAADAEITIDVDTSGTGAVGGKIYLIGHQ